MAVDQQARSLSRPARAVVAGAAVMLALAAVLHLALTFLYVAPRNVLSRSYAEEIDAYIKPEFVQNWKLFAPEPLHVNVYLHARAQVRTSDGSSQVTPWVNITQPDIEATRGNPLPSHTRNQLRKGWRMYAQTHDSENRAENLTGLLLERYLARMAVRRLDVPTGVVERVQLRAATTRVPEPEWSGRPTVPGTSYRVLPWWDIFPGDIPDGGS